MPDVRRIVSDTGPLLHLREAGTLDTLRAAGQVFIPLAVETEIAALDVAWSRDKPEWIETVPLQQSGGRARGALAHLSLAVRPGLG